VDDTATKSLQGSTRERPTSSPRSPSGLHG